MTPSPDLNRLTECLKQEVTVAVKKHQSNKVDSESKQRRADAKKHYKYLQSNPDVLGPNVDLPRLADFYTLPLVARLLEEPVPSILEELKSSSSELMTNVISWNQERRTDFRRLLDLGSEPWHAPDPHVVDPLERLDARIVCVRCDAAPRSQGQQSFDVASARQHDCPYAKKDGGSGEVFSINNFAVNEKVRLSSNLRGKLLTFFVRPGPSSGALGTSRISTWLFPTPNSFWVRWASASAACRAQATSSCRSRGCLRTLPATTT